MNWRLLSKPLNNRIYPSFLTTIIILAATQLCAVAQSSPPRGITLPANTPDTIEQTLPNPSDLTPPLPTESPTPPPEPSLQTPPIPQPPEVTSPSTARFPIKTIEVLGSTVLDDKIAALIQPLENQDVTFEDLINLRSAITQLYIDNGYITSGAFLPNNQALSSGIVKIQVVEGELEQIKITGLKRLQEGYVRRRLELAVTQPLNRQQLEEALQLLQLDPLLEQVNAELTVGSTPGRNTLLVNVTEARAFYAGVAVDNSRAPSIGSLQGTVLATHDNLVGFGDRFSAEYGITEGLNLYNLNYTIPLNAHNGTLSLGYNNGDSRIIADQFQELDLRSETHTISASFRQPIVRSPQTEVALGLGFDRRHSQTFILDDIPFSFSIGPEEGEANVTVVRFSQDWVNRGATRVLAARSQFSLGLDAFDATINDTGTDGEFFSWLGQFQWVQRLSPTIILLTRINAQLTPDSLLPLERFSMGGVATVRGYQQNQFVADNGILGSVEVRIPLTSDARRLQLIPFFDIGTAWNNEGLDPDPATIASLGLGLRWLIGSSLDLRLDYGIPLIEVNNEGNSLQENGLYFSLRYQP